MCEVAREIVRGELIGWIHPLVSKIFRPLLQLRPIPASEIGIALRLGQCSEHQKHVAALFNRHLIFFSTFSSPIDLPVGFGICAKVEWCERKAPAARSRVF